MRLPRCMLRLPAAIPPQLLWALMPWSCKGNKLFHNCFNHSVSSQKKEKVTNTCSVPDVILRTQLPRMQSDRHGNLSNLMLPVTKSSVLPSKKCGMVTSQKNCFVIIKYDAKYDFKSPRAYLPWRRHSVIMVMSLWMLSPSVCVCLSHTEFFLLNGSIIHFFRCTYGQAVVYWKLRLRSAQPSTIPQPPWNCRFTTQNM